MTFNCEIIEELASTGKLIRSENGYTSGVTYRERYKLPDGRFLSVTRDKGVGNNQITEYRITATNTKRWGSGRLLLTTPYPARYPHTRRVSILSLFSYQRPAKRIAYVEA